MYKLATFVAVDVYMVDKDLYDIPTRQPFYVWLEERLREIEFSFRMVVPGKGKENYANFGAVLDRKISIVEAFRGDAVSFANFALVVLESKKVCPGSGIIDYSDLCEILTCVPQELSYVIF